MATEVSTFNTFKHIFIIVSVSIAAFLYYQRPYKLEKQRVSNVLHGLLEEEKSVNLSSEQPVAVGFGSCVDIFVDGISFVNSLKLDAPKKPKYHESIRSLQDISEMFALYLSEGAAAERYVSEELLKTLVEKAVEIDGTWAIGGNAPVIASRFARSGFKVYVGGEGSKKFLGTYNENVEFSDGFTEYDDIHLVMEFKVGQQWGDYTVTRANRFILHSDKTNPRLGSLESFQEVVEKVKPRLIVIGGLQMLDNVKYEGREERMNKLKKFLQSIPPSIFIHFEMASFIELEMMESLQENVLPYVDSLGMNEQELPNIVSVYRDGKTIEVADANPRTARILDDLRLMLDQFKSISIRGLTRVHVHTLAWQAIWIKKGSAWKNTRAGSAKASLVANRYVCGNEKINTENARLIMDDSFSLTMKTPDKRIHFDELSPISCWNEENNEICLAPVLVCTKVKVTAGCGDNITPSGLMPQL